MSAITKLVLILIELLRKLDLKFPDLEYCLGFLLNLSFSIFIVAVLTTVLLFCVLLSKKSIDAVCIEKLIISSLENN